MRNMGSNVRLIVYPVLLCLMLKGVQDLITGLANLEEAYTDCSSERKYISLMGGNLKTCPMPHPPKWPALFQVPAPQFRAARGNISTSVFSRYQDLPLDSCKKGGLGQNLFGSEPFGLPGTSSPLEFPMSDTLNVSSNYILGTSEAPSLNNYFEYAFTVIASHMYIVLPKCKPNLYFTVSVAVEGRSFEQDVECLEALQLWRDSSLDINHELFIGYRKGNLKEINEFLGAYDFLDTNENNFNVTVWYNGSYSDHPMIWVLRAVNVASNSFLQFSKGAHVKILLLVCQRNGKRCHRTEQNEYFCSSWSPIFHMGHRVTFPAIMTVVTVAEILKNNGLAVEKKIMTSTIEMIDESRR